MGQKLPLCGSPIDYDNGFNYLVCTHCNKQYTGRELSKAVEDKLIILRGDFDMDVQLVRGDEIIVDGRDYGTATITPPKKRRNKEISASIGREGEDVQSEASEVTNQIVQLAMQNGGNVMQAVREVAEQRISARQQITPAIELEPCTPQKPLIEDEKDDDIDKILTPDNIVPEENGPHPLKEVLAYIEPANGRTVQAVDINMEPQPVQSTDLPEAEQVGNRIKPAPPIMEEY